jgi:hypothetical protein
MAVRTAIGIVLALALGAAAIRATGRRVTGLVRAATGKSLQITTIGKETTTIGVDDKTGYLKWMTRKPWQQTRATSRSVVAGSCVEIELRADDDTPVARIVRIDADGPGTSHDRCKAIR